MPEPVDRNAGYDDFLDAVSAEEPYYLECPNEHGSLTPRRACPQCGATTLNEEPLPPVGTIETYTIIAVATPQLAEDTPYVTAVVDFGPVQLTAFLRGLDHEAVETGLPVSLTVETTETTGDRALVVRP